MPNKLVSILIALFLCVIFTYLYFDTRTAVHTFDALSYTNDVETKPFGQLYHPHHLLYGPLGRLAFDIAQNLGYEGRADAPIQGVNALAGSIGVVLVWLFGVQFTGKRWPPLGIAVLIGTCYAYWLYATEVEVYTLAAMFILLTLYFFARLETSPTSQNAIFAGIAAAGAVMFHQTNILFFVPASIYFLLDSRLRKFLLLFGNVACVLIAVPYLAVGWNSGFRDAAAYYDWLTGYAQTGQWGGNLNLDSLDALQAGLENTVSSENSLFAALFYGMAILGFLVGFRALNRAWIGFSLTWLILYGAFFWWWEPWNIEFWIVLLPLWAVWMLSGLRIPPPLIPSPQAEKEKRNIPLHLWGGVWGGVALCLALLLFRAHDAPIRQSADSHNDYYQQITRTLAPHLKPRDVVVTRGNILDLYVPFYAEHSSSRVVSLRELRFTGNPFDVLVNRLTSAYQQGNLIFIDQIILDEPFDGQRNPFGLTADEIDHLKTRFPIQENIVYDGNNVFYSIGKRTPPDAKNWTFENQLHGWEAFGLNNPRFENGGWCFTGGGDPWIESPTVQINAAEYSTLEIEMDIFAPAREGQVFWMRQDEGLSEDRSLRFPLTMGRQTYTLNLAGQKGWEDDIVFLRLDPIPENTDVMACVYAMRLSNR